MRDNTRVIYLRIDDRSVASTYLRLGTPVWNILGEGPLTDGMSPAGPAPRAEAPLGFDGAAGEVAGALGRQERARCAQTDPEAFVPEEGGSAREAKRVCVSCEVRAECLECALADDGRFGIWGGLSERERRKLKRRAI